eukprot:XP_001708424.1 Hypothetical protein GL50803_31575 [Giardia lamblia ATCC 50803]
MRSFSNAILLWRSSDNLMACSYDVGCISANSRSRSWLVLYISSLDFSDKTSVCEDSCVICCASCARFSFIWTWICSFMRWFSSSCFVKFMSPSLRAWAFFSMARVTSWRLEWALMYAGCLPPFPIIGP